MTMVHKDFTHILGRKRTTDKLTGAKYEIGVTHTRTHFLYLCFARDFAILSLSLDLSFSIKSMQIFCIIEKVFYIEHFIIILILWKYFSRQKIIIIITIGGANANVFLFPFLFLLCKGIVFILFSSYFYVWWCYVTLAYC